MTNLNDFIVIDPDIREGKPCIKGTRITAYDILEYLVGGMSEADLLKDFPSLRPEHLRGIHVRGAAHHSSKTMAPFA